MLKDELVGAAADAGSRSRGTTEELKILEPGNDQYTYILIQTFIGCLEYTCLATRRLSPTIYQMEIALLWLLLIRSTTGFQFLRWNALESQRRFHEQNLLTETIAMRCDGGGGRCDGGERQRGSDGREEVEEERKEE
ncbi:hypothetical protein F511_12492 [Dorcoceras hygrometricum]|uniref:Uncharacterized protein n=1 Tax=Dorcoceras hygrometricum TaxID=472368 RepID=A0A2Z7C7A1_9LAMI|nr:hypothetical protein F511_12492 [Dorcoceras hygrometricum]